MSRVIRPGPSTMRCGTHSGISLTVITERCHTHNDTRSGVSLRVIHVLTKQVQKPSTCKINKSYIVLDLLLVSRLLVILLT